MAATEPDPSDSPSVGDIVDLWLDRAIQVQASDLHFEPDADGLGIKIRIDGILHLVKRVDVDVGRQVIHRLMVMASLYTHHQKRPQEGRADFTSKRTGDKPINLRVSTFPTVWGTRGVVRFFHGLATIPQLEQLGYNDTIVKLLKSLACQSQGMVLLAGPAGSGKTTTVYSLLRYIQGVRPGCSIISIEDPVEYDVDGITQVQIGHESDGLTYKEALKSLLRQDPQVVVIGEVRDAATAEVCLEAALTGHLLISTIHSPSIAGVIIRLLEMRLPPYQLASALTGVVSQRLVRKLCDNCKIATQDPEDPYIAAGCGKCFKTGYRGRLPIGEASHMTSPIRKAIMDSPDVETLNKILANDGLRSLRQDAQRLVKAGLTTKSQLVEVMHTVD